MPLSRKNSRGGSQAGSHVSCTSVPRRARSVSAGWKDAEGKRRTRPKTLVRGASAPGLDEPMKRRRAKRSGYNHPAAMPSVPDLLYMPPDAHFHSKREDPVDSFTAAGVTSDRMVQLLRCCLEDSKKTAKPGYQPTTRSDPILHKQSEDEEQRNDAAIMQGAAGVRTDRLTFLNTNWISEHDGQDKEANPSLKRTDPISHVGGPPEPITKGIRRFEQSGSRSVALSHNNGRLTQLPQDAVKDLVKTKEVKMGGGEVIYNVAGGEDMIPPATRPYMKSDRPASAAYRAENEKRLLPGFFRWRESQRQSPTLGESEDMYHVMYGDRAQHAMCKAQDSQFFAATLASPTGAAGSSTPPVDRTLDGRRAAGSASVDRLAGFAGFPTCRDIEGRRTARSASSLNSGSPAKSCQRTPLTQREQRRHSDPSGRSKNAASADSYGRRARAF